MRSEGFKSAGEGAAQLGNQCKHEQWRRPFNHDYCFEPLFRSMGTLLPPSGCGSEDAACVCIGVSFLAEGLDGWKMEMHQRRSSRVVQRRRSCASMALLRCQNNMLVVFFVAGNEWQVNRVELNRTGLRTYHVGFGYDEGSYSRICRMVFLDTF